jgi:hypothetical protein
MELKEKLVREKGESEEQVLAIVGEFVLLVGK